MKEITTLPGVVDALYQECEELRRIYPELKTHEVLHRVSQEFYTSILALAHDARARKFDITLVESDNPTELSIVP